MTKHDAEFDVWFNQLCKCLSDEGIRFSDPDSVRDDYEQGKTLTEVFEDIKEEYAK